MSKTEKLVSFNLETKFTNLVLNPCKYKETYKIDDQTIETLLSLDKSQKDLIIKSFANGTKNIFLSKKNYIFIIKQFTFLSNQLSKETNLKFP